VANLQGVGYEVGCGISAAGVTLVCFGSTTDSMEEDRAELIAIILNVAATLYHIFRCIHNIQSIDQ
jgi:hypothetical protein